MRAEVDFVELSSHRAIRTGTTPDLRPDLHRRLLWVHPGSGAGGAGGMVRGEGVSESATKALRVGIGGEKRRGISTILLARSGSIRAFVADLDNPPGADRPGRGVRGPGGGRGGCPGERMGSVGRGDPVLGHLR